MRLSDYTILVPGYPKPGEHLIFNTRTQAMVKINEELKNILETLEHDDTTLSVEHKKNLDSLYRMGIVVRDEAEDRRKLNDFLQQLKLGVDRSRYVATILTTYDCNFQCTYCFESNVRQKAKLDFPTASLIVLWLQQRIEKFGLKSLYLNFYGGEPLLNPGIIEYICTEMKTWCAEREVRFSFGLQTNGYLLTRDLVEKFKGLGLSGARVTVDGVKEEHDRNRPLHNGQGTFDRIFKNIEDNVDKIRIDIASGYDQGDIQPLKRLLDYFEQKNILHKLGNFVFSPIQSFLGPKDNPSAVRRPECLDNFEDMKIAENTRQVRELLAAKGLPLKSGMSVTACPLTREHGGVTMDPLGYLYNCNMLLGYPEFSVGHVRSPEFNERHQGFLDLDAWRRCPQNCRYLPMCSGGCRVMSFLEHKTFTVPICKKGYLDKMAPEFIKNDYEEALVKKANRI